MGTNADDTLTGTNDDDTFDGLSGIDTILEKGDVNFTLSDNQITGFGNDKLISIERAKLIGGNGDNLIDASD